MHLPGLQQALELCTSCGADLTQYCRQAESCIELNADLRSLRYIPAGPEGTAVQALLLPDEDMQVSSRACSCRGQEAPMLPSFGEVVTEASRPGSGNLHGLRQEPLAASHATPDPGQPLFHGQRAHRLAQVRQHQVVYHLASR